jgi:hypothetical protein
MIFVRNLRSALMTADSLGGHVKTLYSKELLLLGGWTRISDDGDAAWVNCVLVNELGGAGSGFQVRAANPRIVYSTAGVFTAAMVTNECSLFLHAASSQNRLAARIVRFIDVNNVEIEPESASPTGWADEGGLVLNDNMPGRVVSPKAATLATGTAWTLLQAPTGNHQARVLKSATTTVRCFSRPLGGAGTATEIPSAGVDITSLSNSRWFRFNAVFDDNNAVIYGSGSGGNTENGVVVWGALVEVATSDTDPNFIMGYFDMTGTGLYPPQWPMFMLNGNAIPVQISVYPITIKVFYSTAYYSLITSTKWRLQNGKPGKLALYRPLVAMANVLNDGGCIRGRIPSMIRQANTNLESSRPIDAAGAWLHLFRGFVVPRNGPNDPLPRVAYSA